MYNSNTAAAAGKLSSRKGVPNKATQDLRDRVMALLDDNWERVEDDIKALAPKERLDTMLKLLEFALPKLARNEIQGITDIDELLSLSSEERTAEIQRLMK